ncbi:amidohydrolase family protein [Paralimibaculum aggregatum]|uniref:Amidohydrolase family protein n=1 Tax=Paralimibaculum aggregatum TaxID=3036245 RepID=A0ABQ6LQ87_9RHOB|nr:amidohydrolase family protein [Limibaculum sp. NKW23]GMG82791.1 amidohydrolase family protein [Limibaculum sp. NKW23]
MQIVDSHHHIWRQADLPWLLGPMQPRIFGPYEPIRRDYGIEEYLADTGGTGVVKSVYVQANWAPNWAADEAVWVSGEAARTGWPHAIVAHAEMTRGDVRPALDRLAQYPLVRGIRQQLHWHRNKLYRFAARPDLCEDAAVQANIAHLADYGWSFDLQVFPGQMEGAARLAEACPDVTFILQHAGMLEDLSDAGRDIWRAGMARLAGCPNVVTKTSGLGTFIHRVDAAQIARILAETVELFGAERCLWGSNFPIEKLWTGFGDLLAAHRQAAETLSETEQAALFHDTAARVYRL